MPNTIYYCDSWKPGFLFKLCEKMSKAVVQHKKVMEQKRLEEQEKANAFHIARSLEPFNPVLSESKVSSLSASAAVSNSSSGRWLSFLKKH